MTTERTFIIQHVPASRWSGRRIPQCWVVREVNDKGQVMARSLVAMSREEAEQFIAQHGIEVAR